MSLSRALAAVLIAACASCDASVLVQPLAYVPALPDGMYEGELATDRDRDGIADVIESELAALYFPVLAIHPRDDCPLRGVVYRVSPHPKAKELIAIRFTVLYEWDCGLDSHIGDNEAFGVLVDPAQVAPRGFLALRAIAHQNTICETITTCGRLPGCPPCVEGRRDGVAGYPVLFSSKNKHGSYLNVDACHGGGFCNLGAECALGGSTEIPELVNAGEPHQPLVHDLTTHGFVHPSQGWTEPALSHFDPWQPNKFGQAGRVDEDLVDPAFLIDPSGCRP